MLMNNRDGLSIIPKNSCFKRKSFFKEKLYQVCSAQQSNSVYGELPENELGFKYF